jgi:cytochrome P450
MSTSTVTSWIDSITIEELEKDPNAVYERLRKEAPPVVFLPAIGLHVATTAEACRQIASNSDLWYGFISPAGGRTFGHGAILNENGPLHDDLREMVEPSLKPSVVDQYVEDLVRPIARKFLAEFENDGHADLVAQYAEQVSVRSLGDLLGLNTVSSDKLREWFHKLSISFTNAAMTDDGEFANPDGFTPGDEARAEIRSIVDPLIDNWIINPDHSMLSHWLHDGMPAGQTRDREYIYPTLYVDLLGAMQEPGHAIASTVAGLWSRPEQFERVIDDPSLIRRAIQESVRWTSPIWSATTRQAQKDTTVQGVHLPEGTVVMLSYGSANRDESVYNAPSEYDLDRRPTPHLAFGAGKHGCAGTYFATEVIRIGLEELFEAIPNLERDEDHEIDFWGWGFRGPKELHAKWEV